MRLEERVRGWEAGNSARRFPELVILVTGDGARRAEFERRFAGLPARRIQLRARFLEPEDYPRVVGSADLGLCLHRSSSGLDIPMKIADLFGAGVPVCALDYGACLAERVRHGDNGLLFSNAPSSPTSCSTSSRRSRPTRRRWSACGRAPASRRARRGKRAGPAKPSRHCYRNSSARGARLYNGLIFEGARPCPLRTDRDSHARQLHRWPQGKKPGRPTFSTSTILPSATSSARTPLSTAGDVRRGRAGGGASVPRVA